MFEGPLDLLLHLIVKHKLDIMDIEISLLLEQYLAYMEELDHEDYEYAGEFLEMAARLIYIKTVSLLPKPEEAQELKQELQGRILEYSVCKQLAGKLREQYISEGVFVRRELVLEEGSKAYELTHSPGELVSALMLAGKKRAVFEPKIKARDFGGIVSHKIYSVTAKILFVLKRLYKTGQFEMDRLYDGMKEKSERIATFLAILELTKSGRITLNDDNSVIYFRRRTKEERAKEHAFPEKTEEQRLLEEEGEYIPEDDDEAGQQTEEEIDTQQIPESVRYAVFEPYQDKEEKRLQPLVKRSSERVYKASEIIFLDDYQKKETQAGPDDEQVTEKANGQEEDTPEAITQQLPNDNYDVITHETAVAAAFEEREELPQAEISFKKSFYGVRYYYLSGEIFSDKGVYIWKYIRARKN